MKGQLIIGSRGSKLALWQAEWVRARLTALEPGAEVRIEIIKTSGDVMQDVSLSVIGGQGVFTKEIENALIAGRIDVAVHSLKDLPTLIPDSLSITAVPERADPQDALVLPAGKQAADVSLRSLPVGARVGTSSLRRQAQLRHLRPDLLIADVRGNVDTRLRKLDAGEYDAIILASAGLRRLGLEERISAAIPSSEMLPAVGQGALGIETRADDADTNSLVARLNHAPTHAAVIAERALLRHLGGGCQVPIAAHATVHENSLSLDGLVAALTGEKIIREVLSGDIDDANGIGERLASRLQDRGADSLLAAAPMPLQPAS
ncbi:MAG: hydroxymethylbilane synthase [Pyrinomonadaceae bacterium]